MKKKSNKNLTETPKKSCRKNRKKTIWLIAIVVVALAVAVASVIFLTNCNKGNDDGKESTNGYLTLNQYNIELQLNETFELEVNHYDGADKKLSIKNVSYKSDSPSVVSVQDGTLKACNVGETYVHVEIDGLSVACFVTVLPQNNDDGLKIKLINSVIYKGVPIRPSVCEYKGGEGKLLDVDIEWSSSDDEVLLVSGDTIIPQKTTDSVILKAKLTYEGKEHNLKLEVKVEEPYAYFATSNDIKLANVVTYAKNENTKYTSVDDLKIIRRNVVDNSEVTLTGADISVSSVNDSVATASISNNCVKVQAVGLGQTNLNVSINGTPFSVGIRVTVVVPIATIADMDALSLACYSDVDALSSTASYMMVDDIDYKGQVIYPIAPARQPVDGRKNMIGIQWKYILDAVKVNGKIQYKYVDRDKVGKLEDEKNCYGLTDEEFIELAKIGGINKLNSSGDNTYSFNGKFDGNGHAIKNAKIMNGSYVAYANNKHYAYRSSIFVMTKGATIENVGFVNITMQSLNDFSSADGKTLYRYYDNETQTIKDESEDHDVIDSRISMAIIGFGWDNGMFRNIYVEMDKSNTGNSSDFVRNGESSGLIFWNKTSVVENCVVKIISNPHIDDCALDGVGESVEGRKGYYNNNLCIGVDNVNREYKNKQMQDGNIWTNSENWSNLKEVTAGSNVDASKVKTLNYVISTFDASVWDFTEFNNSNKAPELKKGCSVKG